MRVIKFHVIVLLLLLLLTVLDAAKFNSTNVTIHIHDTFFVISYVMFAGFIATTIGLVLLFGILFRRPLNRKRS